MSIWPPSGGRAESESPRRWVSPHQGAISQRRQGGGIHHPRPEEVLYGHPVRSFQGPGAENRHMGPHRGDFVETVPERYQDSKHTLRRAVGAASDGLPRCEQSDPVLKSDRPKGTSHVQQLGDW